MFLIFKDSSVNEDIAENVADSLEIDLEKVKATITQVILPYHAVIQLQISK